LDECYYLTVYRGGPRATRHPITETPQTIGRSERADIILREASVSREHARIRLRNGVVHLEDLGSKHGTFINCRRVAEAELRRGDIILIGLAIVLRLERGPAYSAKPESRARETEPQVGGLSKVPTETTDWSEPDAPAPPRPLSAAEEAIHLAALGRVCVDLLPGAYARLTVITDQLRRLIGDPHRQVDPKSLLVLIEPVLSSIVRLMSVEPPRPNATPDALSEVVELAVQQATAVAKKRRVELAQQVPGTMPAPPDPEGLAEILGALLITACQQAPHGSTVSLTAKPTADGAEIEIVDQGPGYGADVVEAAFRPRAATTLEPAAQGLRQAWRSAESWGGSLSVEWWPSVGSVVRLRYPSFDPDAFSPGE